MDGWMDGEDPQPGTAGFRTTRANWYCDRLPFYSSLAPTVV